MSIIEGVSYRHDDSINGWEITIRGHAEKFHIKAEHLDAMEWTLAEYLEWLAKEYPPRPFDA